MVLLFHRSKRNIVAVSFPLLSYLLLGLSGRIPAHHAFVLFPTTPTTRVTKNIKKSYSSFTPINDGRSRRAASTLNDAETTETGTTSATSTTPPGDNNNNNKPQQPKKPTQSSSSSSSSSFRNQLANSGIASAALLATAAVNQAVSMRALEAPSVQKTYISLDDTSSSSNQKVEVDNEGLPLVYDKDLIQAYWSKQRGALNQRWSYFVGKAVPFLTKLISLWIKDGGQILPEEIPALSRQARLDLQDLGPTFIKLGQMMSVRPDILPESTLQELSLLQDSVIPFDTQVAIQQIETELGGPLGQFFTSISQEPVAGTFVSYLPALAVRRIDSGVTVNHNTKLSSFTFQSSHTST